MLSGRQSAGQRNGREGWMRRGGIYQHNAFVSRGETGGHRRWSNPGSPQLDPPNGTLSFCPRLSPVTQCRAHGDSLGFLHCTVRNASGKSRWQPHSWWQLVAWRLSFAWTVAPRRVSIQSTVCQICVRPATCTSFRTCPNA